MISFSVKEVARIIEITEYESTGDARRLGIYFKFGRNFSELIHLTENARWFEEADTTQKVYAVFDAIQTILRDETTAGAQ